MKVFSVFGGIGGLPLLIAGAILKLAGPHWFPGAGTVGLILLIAGGAIALFGIAMFALVIWFSDR